MLKYVVSKRKRKKETTKNIINVKRVSQVNSYVKNCEKVSFVGMKPLQVDEILQPRKFAFPLRSFGEEVRHFKGTWF